MKNTIFGTLGEILCPYSCISCGKVGGLVCERCKKYIISGNNWTCLCCSNELDGRICKYCSLPFRKQYYIGERSGLLKELVNLFKYNSIKNCATVFGDLFFELFGDFLVDDVLVPLPTITKHVRARGFDHTKLLAKRVAWRCGGKCEPVLKRLNSTVQVGADANTRKKQAENAYLVKNTIDPSLHYVMVDDIWTTGSSMLAACREMQKAGVKDISVILIARSG